MSAFVVSESTPDGKPAQVVSFVAGMLRKGYRVWSDCPVCNGDARGAWLRQMCGLAGDELAVRLDDFQPELGKAEARKVAGELLALTPNPAGFVSFVGGWGVGKSHLLKSLVNGFRMAGILSVYVRSTGDLLASVRELFGRDSSDAADVLIGRYKSYRVLAIDEVDRFNPTPWARDVVFRVLGERYDRRDSYLTILASNQAPEMMDPETLGYLASRMAERLVVVGGADMRES